MDTRDPMNTPSRRRCTATARSGTRCGRRPIPGGTVCNLHGGKAPQVRAAAQHRLLEAVDIVAAELVRIATSGESDAVRLSACRDLLDRVGLKDLGDEADEAPALSEEDIAAQVAAIEAMMAGDDF